MAELSSWLEGHNASFELIKGDNSVFRVECNGDTIFDRAAEGRFPLYHEIQLRVFRRYLNPEDLLDATRDKWERILKARGFDWGQILIDRAASQDGR